MKLALSHESRESVWAQQNRTAPAGMDAETLGLGISPPPSPLCNLHIKGEAPM